MLNRYDNPGAWVVRVEPHGSRSYVVYLANGCLRYGPNKYGWVRRSLPRAFAKGDRELEKYRRQLRAKAKKRVTIDWRMSERSSNAFRGR